MKSLSQYITESTGVSFVSQIINLNPVKETDIVRFYKVLLDHGVFIIPKDSFSKCSAPFSQKDVESLDKWVKAAMEKFGDDIYKIIEPIIKVMLK